MPVSFDTVRRTREACEERRRHHDELTLASAVQCAEPSLTRGEARGARLCPPGIRSN
jgi:hypothetical protein